MKRFVCAAVAAAFVGLTAPFQASAQLAAFVGGGATIPMGDYADFNGSAAGDEGANVGWQATAGIGYAIGEAGLQVGGRGFYGSNNHDTDGDKTNLLGGTGFLLYSLGSGAISPFVYGEVGFMKHSYKSDSTPSAEGSSTGAVFGGGAGIDFPLGSMGGFVVAGWMKGTSDISGTQFIGIDAGINIPLGGDAM